MCDIEQCVWSSTETPSTACVWHLQSTVFNGTTDYIELYGYQNIIGGGALSTAVGER